MSNETEKTEKEEHEYPNIVERFQKVFQKLGIKKHEGYVDHCAKGNLENLDDVEQKLFEMGLHPSLRNQVINFWAAEIKQPVPQRLQTRLTDERGGKPREGVEGESKPEKYSVDTATGAIRVAMTTDKMALTWDEAEKLSDTIKKELADKAKKGEKKVAYVYDAEAGQVRMAKDSEVGGTMEQAKELKKMADEAKNKELADIGKGKEVKYVYDSEAGHVRMAKEGEVGGTMEQAKELKKMAEESGKGGEKPVTYVYDTADRVVRMAKEGEVGGTFEQAKELKKMAEENGKGREKPVTYVYDTVDRVVRMAKEGEVGGTMEQAKELKKMAEESGKGAEESPFILDPESGWSLNPKARVTGVELMALDAIRRAHESGTPVDPLEALSQAATKMKVFREALGSGTAELPEWMRDPLQFQKTIQELSPKGDNEALKELKEEMTKMREDHHQAELKRRDEQNAELVSLVQGYRGENLKLRDEIEKNRTATGRTAYDLLGDLVQKVPNREDVRAMVMEAVGKGPKLLTRGTGERAEVLEGMAANIEFAAELKAIEDFWFKLG